MCKICIIPGITDETTENAWKLMKKLSKEMTFTDDDGFGYAALGGDSKLFGERWFDPKDSFINRERVVESKFDITLKYKGILKSLGKKMTKGYNDFGVVVEGSPLRTAILHARKATCEKTMDNLHPFVNGNTALVHNGVIHNTRELEMKYSTCDSECIVNEYVKSKVSKDINNIQKMADKLEGYYACGVISKQDNGKFIVDVFRDNTAKLMAYFIKELGTVVIGTPGYNDDSGPIPSACKDLGFTITERFEFNQHSILRLDALTGEVIEGMEFDSTGKAKRRGGNGGTNNKMTVVGSEDVARTWNNVFGTGHHHSHKKAGPDWTDKQKEEELERFLIEGYGNGYEVYDEAGNAIPPIPNEEVKSISEVKEQKKLWEQDFFVDQEGTWHKKVASK